MPTTASAPEGVERIYFLLAANAPGHNELLPGQLPQARGDLDAENPAWSLRYRRAYRETPPHAAQAEGWLRPAVNSTWAFHPFTAMRPFFVSIPATTRSAPTLAASSAANSVFTFPRPRKAPTDNDAFCACLQHLPRPLNGVDASARLHRKPPRNLIHKN